MKIAIARFARGEVVDVGFHPGDALTQRFEILRSRFGSGGRRDLALDQLARLEKLERSRTGVLAGGARPRRRRDEDSRADPHLDESAHLERDDRLTDRCPADAERARELPLGGQPRPGRKFAALDQLRDLVGNLPIQPARLDCLQGHARESSMGGPDFHRTVRLGSNSTPWYRVAYTAVKWPSHRTTVL